MSGFRDPIIGGAGALVYPSIHSPDFVHLVSGWSLNKDGSIEAQSIIIPPGSGGTSVFVQGTAPTANNVGDIWYNSANGNEASRWSGTAWVPFQLGAGAILPGSITAALLAAGIVVAGIVDATTITAATIETATSAPNIVIDAPNNRIAFKAAASALVPGVIETGSTQGDIAVFADLLSVSGANVAAVFNVNGTIVVGSGGFSATLGADGTGYPTVTDLAGLALQVSGSKLANPAGAGPYPITAANTTAKSLGFMTVPAGDVETGSTYEVHASGFFSTGANAPSSATFTLHWGSLSGTAIAALPVATPIATGLTTAGWYLDAELNWASATEVVVTLRVGWHTASGVGGSVLYFIVSDTTGLDTTINQNISLGFQWGSAPTGTTMSCQSFRAGRLA